MATVLFWAVLGALAGACAKSVAWYERRESLVMALVLGTGGGIAGGYLRVLVGSAEASGAVPHGFDGWGMFFAFVGAAVLLAGYHLLVERRSGVQVQSPRRRMAA